MALLTNTVKKWTTYAARESARTLIQDLRSSWHHRRAAAMARRRYAHASGLKLNVGCGRHVKEGWINIDPAYENTLRLDVREPLPFPNGSAAIVYSEHVMEHLEYPLEAGKFMAESLRVLQPGGLFSFALPDFVMHIRAYLDNDQAFYQKLYSYPQDPWIRRTRMHTLNWIFRAYGHKYAYDVETLLLVLTEAGFVKARQRKFDSALDSEDRRFGTMYVEARTASRRIVRGDAERPPSPRTRALSEPDNHRRLDARGVR